MSPILYGIAKETHECYGHGDYGTELRICRLGSYASGPFPPLFTTKEKAEAWIRKTDLPDAKAIPLEVLE